MRSPRFVVGLIATGAMILSPAGVAMAHPWGPDAGYTNGVFFADNNEHTFCFNNLTDKTLTAAQNARDTLDSTTDMVKNMFCGSATDVDVYDNEYGSAENYGYGQYDCRRRSGDVCYEASVYINIQPPQMDDQSHRRKTSCHEFGHSVGLRHFGSGGEGHAGCMVSGQPSDANEYNDHERTDHINARY
ncbi:MAG: hypothetical protein MUE31_05315 [Candidatus Nanopelagicales bacterium]|jgi:hypothetical protein|nr:hypothetical protein [Candidatus Nanopelagicales bacterium]